MASSSSSKSAPRRFVPKLTDYEKKLLAVNDGCFNCRLFFVYHRSDKCTNKFPDPATYKTLTDRDVKVAKRNRKGKAIASVTTQSLNDSDEETSDVATPIAVVMGHSVNPVAYMPSNESNIIEGASDSDSDVSVPIPSGHAYLAAVKGGSHAAPEGGGIAPFRVPHLFWPCIMDGPVHSFPVNIKALFDHGSHAVLISECCAKSLGLRRRKLPVPETVQLAMGAGGKKTEVAGPVVFLDCQVCTGHCGPWSLRACNIRSAFLSA
jgi:hypothetical protein